VAPGRAPWSCEVRSVLMTGRSALASHQETEDFRGLAPDDGRPAKGKPSSRNPDNRQPETGKREDGRAADVRLNARRRAVLVNSSARIMTYGQSHPEAMRSGTMIPDLRRIRAGGRVLGAESSMIFGRLASYEPVSNHEVARGGGEAGLRGAGVARHALRVGYHGSGVGVPPQGLRIYLLVGFVFRGLHVEDPPGSHVAPPVGPMRSRPEALSPKAAEVSPRERATHRPPESWRGAAARSRGRRYPRCRPVPPA
jgi:hypothetical protein